MMSSVYRSSVNGPEPVREMNEYIGVKWYE